MNLYSIKTRILLVVIFALIPSAAVLILMSTETGSMVVRNAKNQNAFAASSIAYQQRLVIETTRQFLKTLTLDRSIEEMDIGESKVLLRSVLESNSYYATVSLGDATGMVVAAGIPVTPYSLADRPYFSKMMERRTFVIGGYVISRSTGLPVLPFTYPLVGPDAGIYGFINAAFILKSYGDIFSYDKLSSDSIVEIADSAGIRLFRHPAKEGEGAGTPVDPKLWAELSAKENEASLVFKESDGKPYLLSYEKIDGDADGLPDIFIAVKVPAEKAFSALKGTIGRSVLLIALSSLFAIVIAWIMASSTIVARLERIVGIANRFAGGDLSVRCGSPRVRDEIGVLAVALDSMADSLKAKANESRMTEASLRAAVVESEILLNEVHHRVKNNFQIISSLLNLQAGSIEDEKARQLLLESESRIRSMALIHETLYQTELFSEIDFATYIESFVGEARTGLGDARSGVSIVVEADSLLLDLEKSVPLGLILNELVTNAFKHGFPDGRQGTITVRLERDGGTKAILEVRDDGRGFPAGFDHRKGAGLGLQLVTGLVEQLHGICRFENAGPGVSALVEFPL
jgi:two-component sensor histidine kinase/HAMP domain-containing protein